MTADGIAMHPRSEETLTRIAGLVGCSVEAFRDGARPEGHAGETTELLRLWLAIEDADDRRSVLDLARSLAKG